MINNKKDSKHSLPTQRYEEASSNILPPSEHFLLRSPHSIPIIERLRRDLDNQPRPLRSAVRRLPFIAAGAFFFGLWLYSKFPELRSLIISPLNGVDRILQALLPH